MSSTRTFVSQATRRGAAIKLPILAKLMVLEDQYNTDFQKLFDWEMAAGGACAEIVAAEARARGSQENLEPAAESSDGAGTESETDREQRRKSAAAPKADVQPSEAEVWADKAHIVEWLRVDPPFAGTDLRPYFTYSRDKLSFGVSASRLAPQLSEPGQALADSVALADEVCRSSPVSVAETLQVLNALDEESDAAGWRLTGESAARVRESDDYREGIAAFFERREPTWSGK